MKLSTRERIGGKIRRRYSVDTPFNRVMEIEEVPKGNKESLKAMRDAIDLIKLSLEIEELSKELDRIYERKVKRYNHE
jgi:hypothetical protein